MTVVSIVPIKLNNERLPNKNLLSFTNGKPLVTYILETLLNVNNIDERYVFCSNEAIIPYLPEGVNFLKRSESLDTQTTTSNDILRSFSEQVDADVYVLSHATSPFIPAAAIEDGIEKVCSGEYDSALTVTNLQNFLWVDGKPFNYNPQCIPRTQDLAPVYEETSGMYVFTKELLVKEGRRVGHKPYLVELSKIEAIDIDEKEDFIIADAIYNHLIKEGGNN